jgi:hypothetical protein
MHVFFLQLIYNTLKQILYFVILILTLQQIILALPDAYVFYIN